MKYFFRALFVTILVFGVASNSALAKVEHWVCSGMNHPDKIAPYLTPKDQNPFNQTTMADRIDHFREILPAII